MFRADAVICSTPLDKDETMKMQVLLRITAATAMWLGTSLSAWAADPGVTATEITLGQTGPYSGPVSVAAPQALSQVAYFKMLNEKGGINGRKINLISLDDGYSPPKAVELTRKLVEQDNVFLIFGQVGTAVAASTQAYLHSKGVPQMLVSTGASRFNNPSKFPLTIGARPCCLASTSSRRSPAPRWRSSTRTTTWAATTSMA
jgi:branched-chain amino acid transport system substrate-binding protein